MIDTFDRMVLTHVAQPAVDVLRIDPLTWSRGAARSAVAAFVVSCVGIAAMFALAGSPANGLVALTLCVAHVVSVREDARVGALQRLVPLASFGRVFQIGETVGAGGFLLYVVSIGLPAWTALVTVFAAALVIADAVAYVSICEPPPPPRRNSRPTALPSGA